MYSTAWKIKKAIVKLSLDFWGFLTCQPSKTSASILTQKYLYLLTLELYSPVSYYDICFRGNKHGAGQAVSREWTVDKCADSYGKKKYIGSYFTVFSCSQQSVSVWTAQTEVLRLSGAQWARITGLVLQTTCLFCLFGWFGYIPREFSCCSGCEGWSVEGRETNILCGVALLNEWQVFSSQNSRSGATYFCISMIWKCLFKTVSE